MAALVEATRSVIGTSVIAADLINETHLATAGRVEEYRQLLDAAFTSPPSHQADPGKTTAMMEHLSRLVEINEAEALRLSDLHHTLTKRNCASRKLLDRLNEVLATKRPHQATDSAR